MIIYAHLIEIFIIFYIMYSLKQDQIIEPEVKKNFYISGVFLVLLLTGNQLWQLVAQLGNEWPNQDFILNTIDSICYAFIPPVITLLLWINQKGVTLQQRILVHMIGPWFILIAIMNIWFPMIFITVNSQMIQLPGSTIYTVLEVTYFIWLLYRYYVHSFSQFPKDKVLISMVVIVVVIGQMAEAFQNDYTTSWGSIAIAYYFLYRAVANLYENTDQLTHVANYYSYVSQLRSIEKKRMTIVAFDLNGLKTYNDTEGHQKGDEYLTAFAQTVWTKMRGKGMLFRTGGDEFVFLSPQKAETLEPVLKKILEKKCDPKYGDYLLSFSYGIEEKAEEESSEAACARADKKMYDMKMEYYRTHERRAKDLPKGKDMPER
ncbi:GGDEF domain-containing protein [[Clostridium] aminophilum]|uniref:Diguanylate cyclase (GGDEF) domain-containing protein n=1 Tax=[Clostridium] aminophilum TaxID=1526 RepID=A0A1I6KKF2_9FIRM|nr:GGDEF domain-containing protein [[Clostridium] aminophilum]SFR91742.1 diguanylate cyclase (GGDEF) domain-containing protein [[Clostridium] aminophilum]